MRDENTVIVYGHLNHPKVMPTTTIVEHIVRIKKTFSVLMPDRVLSLAISRVDRAKFGGNDWNAWSDSVVKRYDFAIELDLTIGKATADVVTKMIRARKPVYIHLDRGEDKTGSLQKVYGVTVINPEDWQAGWTLQIKE